MTHNSQNLRIVSALHLQLTPIGHTLAVDAGVSRAAADAALVSPSGGPSLYDVHTGGGGCWLNEDEVMEVAWIQYCTSELMFYR